MGWHEMTDGVLKTTQRTFADRSAGASLVTFEPAGGTPVVIESAIFRDAHLAVDVETGLQVTSAEPEISFRVADLPRFPAEGDHVVRAGTRYRVIEPQRDGEGGVKCALRRAA